MYSVNATMATFCVPIRLILALLFFTLYCQAELGVLDSSKLEEQESLRFVPDVTLCNSYSTSRGVTWDTAAMYKNVLKPQGAWLYKQGGHIPHAKGYLK